MTRQSKTNPPGKRLTAKIKSLGSLRDGFLVGAGVLYLIGYVVWSIHALRNNMGLLPAVDSQYFIAGLAPAIFLIALFLTIKYIVIFKRKLPDWLDPKRPFTLFVRRVIFAVWVVAALFFWLGLNRSPEQQTVGRGRAIAITLAFVVGSYLVLPIRNPLAKPVRQAGNGSTGAVVWAFVRKIFQQITDLFDKSIFPFVNWLGWLYGIMFPAIILVAGLIWFVMGVYPRIPQELGGIRPRCAYIDVAKEEISQDFASAILNPNSDNSDKTVRSIQVDVLYTGGDSVLVKSRGQKNFPESTTFEIRKEIIKTITWCK